MKRSDQHVQLERRLSLLNGVCLIVGTVIGTGIFLSPTAVIKQCGSVGLSLVVWLLGGVQALLGALCFAELGCVVPLSGGEYTYTREAFGDLIGFLVFFSAMFVQRVSAMAIGSLTFANYLLYPLLSACDNQATAIKITAILCLLFITGVNVYNVRLSSKIVDLFTFTKIGALILITCGGFYQIFQMVRYGEPFGAFADGNIFSESRWNPGSIGLALLAASYAYGGWSRLNCVLEELKNPNRNLPIAIIASIFILTFVYVMPNVAYFTTFTKQEFSSIAATAQVFSMRVFGNFGGLLMPFLVSCSLLGYLCGSTLAASRIMFVAARNGQCPTLLNFVQLEHKTPITSLFLLGALAIGAVLISDDLYRLMTYTSFNINLQVALSIAALLVFRYRGVGVTGATGSDKSGDGALMYRTPLAVPIAALVLQLVLTIIAPLLYYPQETGIGALIFLSGIPIYIVYVKGIRKFQTLNKFSGLLKNRN